MKLAVLFWAQLETSLGAVARIKNFSDEAENENKDDDMEPPEQWPGRGDIHFDNVEATYQYVLFRMMKSGANILSQRRKSCTEKRHIEC